MADIRLRNIVKSYSKEVTVIHGIDLDIEPGEFTVFVGPSGCGKSTLLRMVAGLEDITSGELTIGGTVVNDFPPSKRGVAMVFQSYALYPHMTVAKNMAFGLELAKVPKGEIEQRVKEAADILQLTPYLDRLPKALSGGQRQRVAIGRAIVRQPKVFLFDEPLSNLDAALRTQTRVELAALHRKLGVTTIYVTHDQVEAMTLADKIVVLSKGKIEQVGKPMELYHKPASLFVAGFIGSPQMNLIQGELASRNNATTVGVRPEHLRVQEDGPITGTIKHTEHMGNETFVYLSTADGDVTVRIEGNMPYEPGQSMRFGFSQDNLYRFDANGKGMY